MRALQTYRRPFLLLAAPLALFLALLPLRSSCSAGAAAGPSLQLTMEKPLQESGGCAVYFSARNAGCRPLDLRKLQLRWQAGASAGISQPSYFGSPLLEPGGTARGCIRIPGRLTLSDLSVTVGRWP